MGGVPVVSKGAEMKGYSSNPKVHYQYLQEEIANSGIDPELAEGNMVAWHGDFDAVDIFDWLTPNPKRTNTGRLVAKHHRKYDRIASSYGWYARGVDPMTGEMLEFTRCKYAKPFKSKGFKDRVHEQDNKYSGVETGKGKGEWKLFFARVPRSLWLRISQRYGVAIGNCEHFWQWVRETKVPIVFTEGEKKALSLLTHGVVAIGVPGIWMGTIKRENGDKRIHPDILPFLTENRRVSICFDTETKEQTKIDVNKAATQLEWVLRSHSCKVTTMQLPLLQGTSKTGVDDYLVAGRNVDVLEENAIENYYYEKWVNWQRKHLKDLQKFTGHVIICKHFNAVFNQTVNWLKGKKRFIIGLKGWMGQGKSEFMIEMMKYFLSQEKIGSLSFGVTNALMYSKRKNFEKAGIKYSYHIHNLEGDDNALLKDPSSNLFLCVPSIARLPISAGDDKIIFLDEIRQLIDEIQSGKTCEFRRDAIIANLRNILRNCQGIIAGESELDDRTIKLISILSGIGEEDCLKWDNHYVRPQNKVNHYLGSRGLKGINEYDYRGLLNQFLEQAKTMKPGDKAKALISDNRTFLEAVFQILKSINPEVFNDQTMMLVTSRSQHDPRVARRHRWQVVGGFLNDPTEALNEEKENGFYCLLFSPAMQSGVSIENYEFFDKIYAFRFHIASNLFSQMLGRIRDTEPIIYLWSIPHSRFAANGENIRFNEKTILTDKQIEILSEIKQENLEDYYFEEMRRNEEGYGKEDYLLLQNYAAESQAIKNEDKAYLRENLIEHLKANGYNIIEYCDETDNAIKKKVGQELSEAKKQRYIYYGELAFNADDIDLERANEIVSDIAVPPELMAQANKAFFKKNYPGIENSNLWSVGLFAHLQECAPQLRRTINNRWQYFNNDKMLKLRRLDLDRKIEAGFDILPTMWVNYRQQSAKHLNLKKCGLDYILWMKHRNKKWDGKDEKLAEIANKLKTAKLGKGRDAVAIINSALLPLGYELKRSSYRDESGAKQNCYKLIDKLALDLNKGAVKFGYGEDADNNEIDVYTQIWKIVNEKNKADYIAKIKPKEEPVTDSKRSEDAIRQAAIESEDSLSEKEWSPAKLEQPLSNQELAKPSEDLEAPEPVAIAQQEERPQAPEPVAIAKAKQLPSSPETTDYLADLEKIKAEALAYSSLSMKTIGINFDLLEVSREVQKIIKWASQKDVPFGFDRIYNWAMDKLMQQLNDIIDIIGKAEGVAVDVVDALFEPIDDLILKLEPFESLARSAPNEKLKNAGQWASGFS